MTFRLFALPLALCLGAGCNYVKSQSPVAPQSVTTESKPSDPDPARAAYPSNGPDLVAFVAERHPERLVAHVSHEDRVRNMEFIRDRVIEAGLCGGMDVGWNLKRGVGPKSIDAIGWKHDGVLDVVDIGVAYDDTGSPLRLHWTIVDGPAGWEDFPAPDCR